MGDYLRGMLQRAAAVALIVAGAVFAIVMAVLTVTAAVFIGIAAWIATRFGLRRQATATTPQRTPSEIIDIEMREIPERREHERREQ